MLVSYQSYMGGPHVGLPMKLEMDEVEFVAETGLTIRGPRRRTTVPKEIVDRLALKDQDKIRWVLFHDGRVVVLKVKGSKRGG